MKEVRLDEIPADAVEPTDGADRNTPEGDEIVPSTWFAKEAEYNARWMRMEVWRGVRESIKVAALTLVGVGLVMTGAAALIFVSAATSPSAFLVVAVVFVGVVALVLVMAIHGVSRAINRHPDLIHDDAINSTDRGIFR